MPALLLALVLAANTGWAAAEKGPRCSNGLDNDGDGLIDEADPDCGGGASTGNFHVVIDWDGVVTDHVFNDAVIECANSGALCEISSSDPFTFRIPESY